jgi:hypothetical protein
MNDDMPSPPRPETEAGIATAEDGLVFLDGPDGIAVTLTAAAARETGQNLLGAAALAEAQQAARQS